MGGLFSKPSPPPLPPPPPPPPPPEPLPDPDNTQVQAKKRADRVRRRSTGRESTILSDSARETLG